MKHVDNNFVINKMRSYSSVFSSTYFSKLIQNDDYSFINSNIKKYDLAQVGIKFNTYHDYISYIYKELKSKYRNEYIYKNTFINELLLDKYGVKNTVAINEFRVGNSIADIVMFNGTSKAFEIKTELDSNKRLSNQLLDYKKIFKHNYIITHEALADKYLKYDESVGIIILVERNKSLKMKEIRASVENSEICPNTIIRSIRTSEYKDIIKNYYGKLPEMNSFNMFSKCEELIAEIPLDELNRLFINQLKLRKSNTLKIATFQKELRQMGLAMNINEKVHAQLLVKLNKSIQI